MANITPGYDFEVNETPTRTKFLAQALGLSLGDLSQDVLDGGFLTLLTGDTSGASGGLLTDQGQLWISPDGSIWGRNGVGDDVVVHRAEGGWETRRIWWNRSTAGADGEGWTQDGNTTSATLAGDPDALRYDTGAGIDLFVTAETTHSGLMRLVGRGVCRYYLDPSVAGVSESAFRKKSIYTRIQGPPPNFYWNTLDILDSNRERFVGPVLGLPEFPEATKVTQAGGPFEVQGSVWGYFPSVRQFGVGSAGT